MKPKGDECLPDDFVVECPQPEFPLDRVVIEDVSEPEIVFFSSCEDCGVPTGRRPKHPVCVECYFVRKLMKENVECGQSQS